MRLFNTLKKAVFTAVAVLALGASTLSGVEAEAKTIKGTNRTYKETTSIGSTVTLENVTNLKINGKKYTKSAIKKKVNTVVTGTDARAYQAYSGSYTEYYDDSIVYDMEAEAQKKENYKYITTYDYELTFLKAGTYKISYDTYQNEDDEVVESTDKKTAKITKVLKKTQHVNTYKVLQTTSPIKSFTLGKSKISYSYKRNGSKTTTKTTVKNRYLTGKSGKLKIGTNTNYKLTSAYVVTFDANGNQVITASGNNKNVTYSAGIVAETDTYDKVVAGADGKDTYVTNADGVQEKARKTVTTGESKEKYKRTTIYYGYKDSYTGDYLTYSVGAKTVYVRRLNAKGNYEYDKDGNWIIDAVPATVITRKYPVQACYNGTYKTVEVVSEKVVLSTDKTLWDYTNYWLDAKTETSVQESGVWSTVSRGGIPYYVTLANGSKEYNPVYERTFYTNSYEGSWVQYNEAYTYDQYGSSSYDIDANGNETTRWVYLYKLDAKGERIEKDGNTKVIDFTGSGLSSSRTFYSK